MEAWCSFVKTVEEVLSPLGLMSGDNAILKRYLLGFLFFSSLAAFFKPGIMFDEIGNARPWSLLNKATDQETVGPAPTPFPWYAAGFLGAVMFGVCI